MSLPATKGEIVAAIIARLAALTWPAAIDVNTPVIFRSVDRVASYAGPPYDLTTHLANQGTAVALVVMGGSRPFAELEVFADTTIRVAVLTTYQNDRAGALALAGTKGLDALCLEVRKSMYHIEKLVDSLWLANESEDSILDGGNGRQYVGREMSFIVRHQDVVPS